MKKEIYISIDVETDGPIPGRNSMLSLGAAAFDLDEPTSMIGTFTSNLRTLEGAFPDSSTTEFWNKNPEAYGATRAGVVSPGVAMIDFANWVHDTSKDQPVVAVCYPATFDFMFVYWYLMRFNGASPFGFSALDLKTLGMALTNSTFKGASKRNFPKRWFSPELRHTHVALDDAIEQGEMFRRMMAAPAKESSVTSRWYEAMSLKFESLKQGEILFDVHRQKMGNTKMTKLGWWTVKIISLEHPDADPGSAVVSWNGNRPERRFKYSLERLRRKLPKSFDPDGSITARHRKESP